MACWAGAGAAAKVGVIMVRVDQATISASTIRQGPALAVLKRDLGAWGAGDIYSLVASFSAILP